MNTKTEAVMASEFICLQKTELAQKVAGAFNQPLREAQFVQFADGEVNVVLTDSTCFENKTVVIVQSTGHAVNNLVLGVAFLAQELKNAGAAKIIAVIPYFGYSRQERSTIAHKPGHAAVIAQLFERAGIDELVAVQLHDGVIMKFFSIPVHNLSAESTIANHLKKQVSLLTSTCLIAPDKGAREYVEAIAKRVDLDTLVFSKERFAIDQTRIVDINGYCQGTIGIIIDDIIATGTTAINVANTLIQRGYQSIYGYFVHPVFAGNAIERIQSSNFTKIYVSNSLPLPVAAQSKSFIQQFDISPLIVEALHNIIG